MVCGTNLRTVGQAMRMYLNDSNDLLPVVEWFPSMPIDPEEPRPAIATVLRPYVEKNVETVKPDANDNEDDEEDDNTEVPSNPAFHCPEDIAGKTPRAGENTGKSYYETELSSYMFNTRLYFMRDDVSFTEGAFDTPVKLNEVVRSNRARWMYGGQAAEEEIWLLRDYVPFHGKPGQDGSTNYLYVDGRVSDLER